MELEIIHTTRYEFSQPVCLEPHLLRFAPRADGAQLPLEFSLDIDPQPTGTATFLDAAGNAVTSAWFHGELESLSITAQSVTRTLRENPYDFLLDRTRTMLPVDYGSEAATLAPYVHRSRPDNGADPVAMLAARIRDAAHGELVPLLTSLCHTLYDRVRVGRREEGGPWPPERTWREKCGACRDVAELFVDACRALGVAARFVSGYEDPFPEGESCDLHAWAEAYVPGGGWRGYDPSRGLAVADNHVAVAAAATADGAAPVTGAFRGTGASSLMETHIEVRRRARDSQLSAFQKLGVATSH